MAHRLLAEADHDYSGHRAKAAHHVHLALEDLGHHHSHYATGAATGSTTSAGPATGAAKGIAKGAVPGVAATGKVVPGVAATGKVVPGVAVTGKVAGAGTAAHHESQAVSDRQLREAGTILQKVLGHMNATKHPRARANIQMALSEIGTALSVK
jgi:hypothetical protein